MNLDLFADLPEPVQTAPIAAVTAPAAAPDDGGWNPEMMAAVRARAKDPLPYWPKVDEAIAMAAAVAEPAPGAKPTPYELTIVGMNRWAYKGEIITYDTRKETVPGRGRWASVEGIGKPEIRGDHFTEICAAIDARSTTP